MNDSERFKCWKLEMNSPPVEVITNNNTNGSVRRRFRHFIEVSLQGYLLHVTKGCTQYCQSKISFLYR